MQARPPAPAHLTNAVMLHVEKHGVVSNAADALDRTKRYLPSTWEERVLTVARAKAASPLPCFEQAPALVIWPDIGPQSGSVQLPPI